MGFTNTGLNKRFTKNITFCVLAVFCLSAFLIASCENPLMEEVWGLKTITFNTNGGTAVPAQRLIRGEKVTKPGNPSKEGHDFGGWYEDNEVFEYEWDFNDFPTEAMTLYAKWEAAGSVYYTLILDTGELDSRDSVSFTDSASLETGAFNGSTVSINYTLAETDDVISELRFYISDNKIFTADQPGSGVYDYVVKTADAANGIITIRAVSIHTDLIPLDAPREVSLNSNGGISFTTGENNNSAGAAFMFTLYKNSEPVPLFSNISIESGGGSFPGLRSEMLKEAGAYSVRVWAQTSNPAYLSPSLAAYSNDLNVLRLIINTDGLEHGGGSVSFSDSIVVNETTAFNGSSVIVYYTLNPLQDNNLLDLVIDGSKKYETKTTGHGQYNYTVDSDDADGRVITIYANSSHSYNTLLLSPDDVHFDKTGMITFTPDDDNPSGTTFRFTLYLTDTPVSGFENLSISNGSIPANIVNKMLENAGDYYIKVWAVTSDPAYVPLSDSIKSQIVHVYQVSVNINDAVNGDKITAKGTDHNSTFSLIVFADDIVTLDAKPSSGRMVTWSGNVSGTGNTRTFTVTETTTVTAAFSAAPVTVTAGSVTTGYANLTAALNSITTAGDYIVTLLTNQTLGARTMDTAGVNITLVSSATGAANERTIQYNGAVNARMFLLNNTTTSLTLGNNITILGINGTTYLIGVEAGVLTMENGSKITGHTTTTNAGTICVENENSRFVMNGGIITANNSASANTSASGGIWVSKSAAAAINGGSLSGNSPSDIFIDATAIFNLSGNAEIGSIILSATVGLNAAFNLGEFNGTLETLNLRGNTPQLINVIGFWVGKPVIQAASGYTLTADDIAKFPLGNFSSQTADDIQPISNTYMLGTVAPNIGVLIAKPTVTVDNGTTTTFHTDLAAAFTAIGAQTGNFTVTLLANQTMTTNRTSIANQHITIIGEGAERMINGSSIVTTMFTINTANASLTLGNNVTIRGRSSAGSSDLVYITAGTFRMLEGSKITGHQASGASYATVYINGSSAVFEMSGGSINGNNNTTTASTTTASGGVLFNNGVFTMTGGSITGNTQGTAEQFAQGTGEASDVYHNVTTADRFTMSGNAAIGALKMNATSTSTTDAAGAIIAEGWLGSINKLNLRGNVAEIATVSQWWDYKLLFNGINAAKVNSIGLGEFINNNNSARQAIDSLYFIGTSDNELGRLRVIPAAVAVTVTANNGTSGYLSIFGAFTAIGKQTGDFTVTLLQDLPISANITINTAGQNVTITGSGGIRTINGSSIGANTTMFTINTANASLTLGNNVTIQGRNTPGNSDLVYITAGTFRMLEGSKITGHQVSGASYAAVYINGSSAVFEMSGGSIDGNINTTAATTTTASGGVFFTGGKIIMTGGSITGNTHGTAQASDVYHAVTSANSFTMSGNANIGALKLNAITANTGATVGAAGWTGAITTLNLRGDTGAIETASGYWTGSTRTIFNNIDAAQVNNIGLGEFISSNNARQAISLTHMIGTTTDTDLGKLVAKLLDSPSAVADFLSVQSSGNSVDNPIYLKVNIPLGTMTDANSGWQQLLAEINTSGKFVTLDMSDCEMTGGTAFNPVSSLAIGKDRIVAIVLPDGALSISNGSASNPTFNHFTNLTSISGESIENTRDYAFFNLPKLTTVDFPAATNIGNYAFYGCTSLTNVSFSAAATISSAIAFSGCSSLTNFNLTGSGQLSVLEDGRALVINATALVAYPSASGAITMDSITTIRSFAFYENTNLISVSFPEVTSINQTGFGGCINLTSVSIPMATSIAQQTFRNTGDIPLSITLGSSAPTLGINIFTTDEITNKNVTVRIPNGVTGYGSDISGTDTTTQSWANALRGMGWNGTSYDTAGTVNTGVTVVIEQIP